MANEKSIRVWHPNFKKYTEFITNHKNYEGLFFEKKNGQVKWVVAGKSPNGLLRRKWWDKKCRENNIDIKPGCYAKIALILHPTNVHVCQICGKKLSIEYVYPNKKLISRIKKNFNIEVESYCEDVFSVIQQIHNTGHKIEEIKKLFGIKDAGIFSLEDLKLFIKKNYVDRQNKTYLSPGVMSNSPDRFDGYHSDGICCRAKSDTGRHKNNLKRYAQDRRVYENWADGNWKKADRLMGVFRKHSVSPDHIGPISLGFCHRAKFFPMTRSENSAKNNRMSFRDVKTLIDDEKREPVISWHSRFIWDKFKLQVEDDADAVKLSNIMRENLHQVLLIFSKIKDAGHAEFLSDFLNPHYSYYDYIFHGFDPSTGNYDDVEKIEKNGKNQKNNAERYLRIAFEELENYSNVENRKTTTWKNEGIDQMISELLDILRLNNKPQAKSHLEAIFKILAEEKNLN